MMTECFDIVLFVLDTNNVAVLLKPRMSKLAIFQEIIKTLNFFFND